MPKPKPARRPFTLRMYFEWLAICIGVAGLVCLTNVVNLYLQAKPLAEAPECPRERAEQNDSADCRLLTRAVVESVVPNKFNALVNLKVPVRGDIVPRVIYVDIEVAGAFRQGEPRMVEMFKNQPVRIDTGGEMALSFSHPGNAWRTLLNAAIMCLALGLLGLTSRVVRRKREAAAAA